VPSRTTLLFAALSLSLTGSLGCPSEKTCEDYAPPATFDAQTPAVSFSLAVMPVFANKCALPTCHGSASGDNNGIYLGNPDPAKTHDALVNVAATELPAMHYVTPGDPRQSFLMRKLDASQCVLDAQCTDGTCGVSMPRNDAELSLDTRDAIRRWVAQGAKNN
jgi:hypothetical protein